MEINEGQKWICFKNIDIIDDDSEDILQRFIEGDIITITSIDFAAYSSISKFYPYFTTAGLPLSKSEIITNFVLLADWRDKQINSILNEERR